MRKIADAVGAGKTGLLNGVVVGQRGLSREGPLYPILKLQVYNPLRIYCS